MWDNCFALGDDIFILPMGLNVLKAGTSHCYKEKTCEKFGHDFKQFLEVSRSGFLEKIIHHFRMEWPS